MILIASSFILFFEIKLLLLNMLRKALIGCNGQVKRLDSFWNSIAMEFIHEYCKKKYGNDGNYPEFQGKLL